MFNWRSVAWIIHTNSKSLWQHQDYPFHSSSITSERNVTQRTQMWSRRSCKGWLARRGGVLKSNSVVQQSLYFCSIFKWFMLQKISWFSSSQQSFFFWQDLIFICKMTAFSLILTTWNYFFKNATLSWPGCAHGWNQVKWTCACRNLNP